MCIFSGPVRSVRNTRIFARSPRPGVQTLVYSMAYATDTEIAMILPLPVGSHDESAVRFLSLEAYPSFFDDMLAGFPSHPASHVFCDSMDSFDYMAILEVHEIGAYEASFVPTLADFARLDRRFTLPITTWELLPEYADYAFVVFKLRVPTTEYGEEAHPMAFEFVTRYADSLYFPTVHIHDGQVHPKEQFDHQLYYQGKHLAHPEDHRFFEGEQMSTDELATVLRQQLSQSRKIDGSAFGGWQFLEAWEPASKFMQIDKAQGIVASEEVCYALILNGLLPNEDTWIQRAID